MDGKAALLRVLDEEGLKALLLEDVIDGVIKKKLDELVADTSNALDDALLGMLFPPLRKEVEKFIDAKLAELKA